jgi:uncharacterized membrane protein SirB2
MLPYEFYKVAHVLFILTLALTIGAQLLGHNQQKGVRILQGIATFLTFVAGMGLMARLGISHTGGYPMWVKVKMGLWFCIAVGAPVFNKRAPAKWRGALSFGLLFLMLLAAYSAVYKIGA